jgi:hypothetical protein
MGEKLLNDMRGRHKVVCPIQKDYIQLRERVRLTGD